MESAQAVDAVTAAVSDCAYAGNHAVSGSSFAPLCRSYGSNYLFSNALAFSLKHCSTN